MLSAPLKKQDGLPGGIALIAGAGGKLTGIVTDGDVRRGIARGISLDAPVSRIANRQPIFIPDAVSLRERAAYIRNALLHKGSLKKYVEKVVVVDKNGAPTDVLTTYDIWQTADSRLKRVGVVGLGYVGLTLSLTLAELGFTVFGLEKNKKIAANIAAGTPHFHEDGLAELLKAQRGKNFMLVDDFEGSRSVDVYVIAVGTPLTKSGAPDASALKEVALSIGRVLKRNDLVVLRSTVAVGMTRDIVVPILEKESGLSAGSEFLVAFAPERTVEGKALQELRALPQIVGGFNRASAESAASVFSFLTHSVVTLDSLEEAEMVKLINNTYRDVTFGFANEVALIAEKWGVRASKVIKAANFGYERSAVPLPSPGVGGYCLAKDPQIFSASARAKGYRTALLTAGRRVNTNMLSQIANYAREFLAKKHIAPRSARVLIFGVAYKGIPKTSDMRGSPALEIAEALRKSGVKNITAYDTAVSTEDIKRAGLSPARGWQSAVRGADVILCMNNNPDFASLDIKKVCARRKKPLFIFDGWGMFREQELDRQPLISYHSL
ncbi:MAG: UDP-glucose 6-dehydrogenase [Parcubacteria group bacterium GW2011_GWA2_47_12]|nr:MAG: UDP-glucose 6-dehydrogenase [Parcubacteria group bacterium GW2011_GWA2_47_12]